MGYNINVISQTVGVGLKRIYNRRALLIRKLNLPNDNVLIMLSGVLLLLNSDKNSHTRACIPLKQQELLS
ncbi:hypothetical protein SG64_22715 [Enterobacter hormaechei subsp. xiangfangensis]|nr:hypothetical protein SG64_22715 [Enterobacter hormaechei subsp. xiangfangensis]